MLQLRNSGASQMRFQPRNAESTSAWINGFPVVAGGARLTFDDAVVRETLARDVVDLDVSLGVGDGEARAYGCDLTHGYIDENAAYYSS